MNQIKFLDTVLSDKLYIDYFITNLDQIDLVTKTIYELRGYIERYPKILNLLVKDYGIDQKVIISTNNLTHILNETDESKKINQYINKLVEPLKIDLFIKETREYRDDSFMMKEILSQHEMMKEGYIMKNCLRKCYPTFIPSDEIRIFVIEYKGMRSNLAVIKDNEEYQFGIQYGKCNDEVPSSLNHLAQDFVKYLNIQLKKNTKMPFAEKKKSNAA
jgi:hypothetical protein